MIIKTSWGNVVAELEEVYGVYAEMCEKKEDSFFVCPHCDEPIYREDYPEIESEVDTKTMRASFPKCPICGEEYEILIE